MMDHLNHPLAVVAILGLSLSGLGGLLREISFLFSKMKGKSVLDQNALVMKELVTELRTQGDFLQKILEVQNETKEMVHNLAYTPRRR